MTIWPRRDLIEIIHAEQIEQHGGAPGLRGACLLESALARPLNLAAYGAPDIGAMAAAYAIGLCRNHPFVDGNKRTAYVALEAFLALNGLDFPLSDAESTVAMQDLASGELTEDDFTTWVRDHARPPCGRTSSYGR